MVKKIKLKGKKPKKTGENPKTFKFPELTLQCLRILINALNSILSHPNRAYYHLSRPTTILKIENKPHQGTDTAWSGAIQW